ncbi:hypothetical protein P9139_11540 [Curtobacterium flaccumfaciens]|nr:hypothetical protein P9139_11540 [Curtobacterium flaccumfaciens]
MGLQEPFGERDDAVLQVPGVRVHPCELLVYRGGDARVRVADRRHVVVRVEVLGAVGVPEPRAGTADHVDRSGVEERVDVAEDLATAGEEGLVGRRQEPGVGGVEAVHHGGRRRHRGDVDLLHVVTRLSR